jgi:Leucine-rich repeat (LRR) protein
MKILRLSRLAAIGEVVVCTLPAQIGELKNLKYLYLQGNKFSEEEQERIRKLLPKCEVVF